jgi:hypothetical protein
VAAPDTVIDLEPVAPAETVAGTAGMAAVPDQLIVGGGYSVLQHGLVSELIERRSRADWAEAARLLVPASKKGWVVFGVLVALVLLLGTLAQLRDDGETQSKGMLLLRKEFWWGVLSTTRGDRGLVTESVAAMKTCRATTAGPLGTVVDSLGLQCKVSELSDSGCCFGGWQPQASGAGAHCGTCRDSGCCQTYLDCVQVSQIVAVCFSSLMSNQCCLVPDHVTLLRFQFFALSRNGFPGVDSREFDTFELCTALCRTSSKSIDMHGKFQDEDNRFCYLIGDPRANV